MKCKKCSQEISDDSLFCSICGEKQDEQNITNNLESLEQDNIKEVEQEEKKEETEEEKNDLIIDDNTNALSNIEKSSNKKKRKKGKIFVSIIILSCIGIVSYNLLNISNKDIDKALASMETTKIIKILDRIDDEQIEYFEKSAKDNFKKYLLSLGYDYNKSLWIDDTDENFINDLSTKLSFLENQRLNKAGMIYDIKRQADNIVASNKIAEEVDFELADKFYDLEEKSGYVTHRIKDLNSESKYLDLYYVSPEYYAEEAFVVEESEEGVISKGYIEGNFIYLRDQDFYEEGFAKKLPVYKHLKDEEVEKIKTEYNKIEQNIPAMKEELGNLITEFLNSK